MIGRALTVWVLMAIVAVINGLLRGAFLTPRVGEPLGHVLGTLTACAALLTLMWLTLPWIGAADRRDLLRIGGLWLALTVGFEFLAGHYLFGNSWDRLLADYQIARGRVWPAVLLVIALGPLWIGRARGARRRPQDCAVEPVGGRDA